VTSVYVTGVLVASLRTASDTLSQLTDESALAQQSKLTTDAAAAAAAATADVRTCTYRMIKKN